MKAGRGHLKGGSFEREISRKLSLWLSKGKRDDLLWRSAMSGGLATLQFNRGKVNLTQGGDLSAIGEEAYQFCQETFIECKSYQDLRIGRSVLCGTGDLINFWNVAVRESAKYKKRPLLIARQNRYPTIALTNTSEPKIWANPVMVIHHWPTPAFVFLFDNVVRVRLARGD